MNLSWMEGYRSDIEYTLGYYREQEPEYINFSAIMHGVEGVSLNKPFTYCELGCGLGMTSLIMAANYPQGHFIAVDYNPSHIAYATQLAEQAGLINIIFKELSFEEIANDASLLPQCHFISFHGIYAWVNDDNRQYLSTICKQNLKSGGLVYNSYNAQPGWAAVSPLQKMLHSLSKSFSGSPVEQLTSAITYINELRELKPRYFEFNSTMLEPRLEHIKNINMNNANYLVHEYLHEGWQAFHFSEVATQLSAAKLDYIGLANPAEAYSYNIMPEPLRQMLAKLNNQHTREMIKDVAYNTSFRKDIYSRGARKINREQQLKWLEEKTWMLLIDGDRKDFKFALSVGEATGDKETYQAVIDALREKTLNTLELQEVTGISLDNLIQILVFLFSANQITLSYDGKAKKTAKCLNKAITESALFAEKQGSFVAAGNAATALFLNPIEQAFLKLHLSDKKDKNAFAKVIYNDLSAKALNLTHNGNTYVGKAMKEQLFVMEEEWRKTVLPQWEKLGVL